jgi:hypothetical protein
MPAWLRAGFTPRPAFGDLESPAVCQSGAEVILMFAARRPTVRPSATLGPLKEPSEPRRFAPARFETPDHTGDS